MREDNIALIITGCIAPDNVPYLKLTDTEKRLQQYLHSIKYYIEETAITNIIFCENSNYEFDYSEYISLAKKKNKHLEVLTFLGDNAKVKEKGKGYGEGEILQYVFRNSKLIEKVDSIYKVTGRLNIKNINKILEKEEAGHIYFNKNLYSYKSLDTRFWRMPKKIYEDYFMDVYENVNDDALKFLEYVFWDRMYLKKLKYHCHSYFPEVDGVSGSTNEPYRENRKSYSIWFSICSVLKIYNLVYTPNFVIFNWKSCWKNFFLVMFSKIYKLFAEARSKVWYVLAAMKSRVWGICSAIKSKLYDNIKNKK